MLTAAAHGKLKRKLELQEDEVTSCAARIIAKTGEQIEAMIEILGEKLIVVLTDKKGKIRADHYHYDGLNSEGDWLIKSYLWDIALFDGKKQKPSRHVAVQVVLYDENDVQIPGWEPLIYVWYGLGEDEFEIEASFLTSALTEGCHLDGDRLWRYEKIEEDKWWMFAVPLVKLNSEEDLARQIVEPVQKLIVSNNPANAFPTDSVAFRFVIENGNTLHIIVPEP